MKILALSDIHSRVKNLKILLKTAENREFEVILIAGDLTNFGEKGKAKEIIEILKKTKKKIFGITGNLDTKKELELLEEKEISLHGKKEVFEEFVFVGFGGATNCIGETVFSEEEIYEKLKEMVKGEKKVFLLTHSPPKDSSLDKSNSGKHIGSGSVRKIIEEFKPEFSVAGHCHEGFGEEQIGKTFCINVGTVKEKRVALIDTKKKKVEKIQL